MLCNACNERAKRRKKMPTRERKRIVRREYRFKILMRSENEIDEENIQDTPAITRRPARRGPTTGF